MATTSKEHLETRVNDLMVQLQSKEEKLMVYEGKAGSSGRVTDPSLSAEEQLQITVADLRAELGTTKGELERATTNVQQFKDIAEAEGTALSELMNTYETYKTQTDASIAEKDVSALSPARRHLLIALCPF